MSREEADAAPVRRVTDLPCPSCGAPAGKWCQRGGHTQGGDLLACAARSRLVRKSCKQAP